MVKEFKHNRVWFNTFCFVSLFLYLGSNFKHMKRIYIITIVVLVAITLQSCFVAKEYQTPNIEVADQYRNMATSDSSTLADMPWNELFSDAQLRNLIDTALTNNLDLLLAYERVNAAEAYYKQGKLENVPEFNFGTSATSTNMSDYSYSGIAAGGKGPSYENYHLNASISWEADIWGKLRSTTRAARAVYLQSEATQRAVESALVANVASAYYRLLALDAQVEVTQRTVVNRREGLQTMRHLKDAGRVTEAAVKQTEAQLYSTQILLHDLEQSVKLLENTVSLLLGQGPGEIERGKLESPEMGVDIETGYPVQLLRNRPDVIAAELGLVNAFELTNVAKSNFYPALRLTANTGFESIEFNNWFDKNAIFSNVMGNITQPLLNKRKIRTGYEVAKAQQAEARYNFKKAILTATSEVANALIQYNSEQERYKLQKQELNALSDAVVYSEELLKSAYQNTTYLEVLTARSNALSSEINVISSEYNQINSLIELYKALGGGWK